MLLDAFLSALLNVFVLAGLPFLGYFLYHKWRHKRRLGEISRRAGLRPHVRSKQMIPRFFLMAFFLMTSFSACTDVRMPGGEHDLFLPREIVVEGATHRYRVFVPTHRTVGGKTPIILFLHGSGERGSDGIKPTRLGLGAYIRKHADAFPAIVVFPQVPENQEWSDNAALAFAALDAATREFGGDPDRTYLTGLSMGGYGTWELALLQPARFAALVPICGGIGRPQDRPTLEVRSVSGVADPFAEAARRLRDKPIWIFHGAKDDIVLPGESRRMAAALKSAGAADARYTEFPDANHNSWDPAYATPELWAWMFAQKRR